MTSALPRTVVVWLMLMVLTMISWWSGAGHGLGSDAHSLATSLVLVIAFGKVHLVGMHFMELRRAALPLRLVFDTWVVIVPMALIGLYHWA